MGLKKCFLVFLRFIIILTLTFFFHFAIFLTFSSVTRYFVLCSSSSFSLPAINSSSKDFLFSFTLCQTTSLFAASLSIISLVVLKRKLACSSKNFLQNLEDSVETDAFKIFSGGGGAAELRNLATFS